MNTVQNNKKIIMVDLVGVGGGYQLQTKSELLTLTDKRKAHARPWQYKILFYVEGFCLSLTKCMAGY